MHQFKRFSALILSDLRARQVLGDTSTTRMKGDYTEVYRCDNCQEIHDQPWQAKGDYTEVYRCDNCQEIHDQPWQAEDCCAEDATEARVNDSCPACGEEANSYREAADCCLWKDLDAPKRWAIADAVEAGATWQQAIQQHTGQSIN